MMQVAKIRSKYGVPRKLKDGSLNPEYYRLWAADHGFEPRKPSKYGIPSTLPNGKQNPKYSKLYSREWRQRNPERSRDISRTSHKKHAFRRHLKKAYGVSVGEFEAMWKSQEGLCAIDSEPLTRKTGGYAVDHDSETGKVRGLLCMSCNVALGHFNHDLGFLRNAISYLEKFQQKIVV